MGPIQCRNSDGGYLSEIRHSLYQIFTAIMIRNVRNQPVASFVSSTIFCQLKNTFFFVKVMFILCFSLIKKNWRELSKIFAESWTRVDVWSDQKFRQMLRRCTRPIPPLPLPEWVRRTTIYRARMQRLEQKTDPGLKWGIRETKRKSTEDRG